jgi:TDG/mug DNA glycosylase family protein
MFDIGPTDLVKDASGSDDPIRSVSTEVWVVFEKEIFVNKPRYIAFTSKKVGQIFCGHTCMLGRQEKTIGETEIYILPSTSLNARWQWPDISRYRHEFADAVRLKR